MARTKRTSKTLASATLRFSGLRSIDQNLDYGNGLSVAEYETRLNTLQTEILQYNSLLSDIDEACAKISNLEKGLRTYAENILLLTQTRYGKTSIEYQKVGGKIRKAASKRSTSKTPEAPIATSPSETLPTQSIPTTPMAAAMN